MPVTFTEFETNREGVSTMRDQDGGVWVQIHLGGTLPVWVPTNQKNKGYAIQWVKVATNKYTLDDRWKKYDETHQKYGFV